MMKYLISFSVCLLFSLSLSAQYVWDGGGDGTSWNDAMNWLRDEVPATDSIVSFPIDATVTGTAPNIPVGLRIGNQANVVLDLDLTVGNGNTAEHAITFGDTCSLTLGLNGSARTLRANTKSNKHGMAMFGGSEMAAFTINEGSTYQALSGVTGINLANSESTITNNGTITVGSGLKDGIRVVGTFINNGTINGGAVDRDLFNVKQGGRLTNSADGVITSDQPGDDGIELVGDASFVNDGQLMLRAKDNASSGNNTISVGDGDTAASFVNNSNDVNLNGGGGAGDLSGRTLAVDTLGVLTNNGTITISGGDAGSRLHVKGTAENALNGILDLTDGRFNANGIGTFINNGLVKSTRDGASGFVSGTAINNGFYDYSMSNTFASGSMGTIIDKGFSLNNNDVRVNARRECTVDLVNAPYEWFLDGESYAFASDTGAFVFTERSIIADSVVLTTTLPGVELRVVNICAAAVMPNGVFSPAVLAETVRVFPNPALQGGVVTLDLKSLDATSVNLRIVNISGKLISSFELTGGANVELPTTNLLPGVYFISGQTADRTLVARLVVNQ